MSKLLSAVIFHDSYCDALPLSPMALNDTQMTKQGTLSSWQKSRVTWILQAGVHWNGEKGIE